MVMMYMRIRVLHVAFLVRANASHRERTKSGTFRYEPEGLVMNRYGGFLENMSQPCVAAGRTIPGVVGRLVRQSGGLC